MNESHTEIIVIGSINTDMVVKTSSLPQPGETVLGDEFLMSGGGKGANQAVAAARLGAQVSMVGCVGNDMFGERAKSDLSAESINCQHVAQSKQNASGVALISVDSTGENQIVVSPGANSDVSLDQVSIALESCTNNAIVLLQLEIPLQVVAHALELCRARNLRVILDPAPAQPLSGELLNGVFLLTPNETEAQQLTGITITDNDSARAVAEQLLQLGVSNVALTLGKAGVVLANDDETKLIEAVTVDALDTTAAGDCFNGALACALSQNQSLEDSVSFGCKAAAVAVSRLGAQDAMPHQTELEQ